MRSDSIVKKTLSFLKDLKVSLIARRKIRGIKKTFSRGSRHTLHGGIEAKYKMLWEKYGRKVRTEWLKIYTEISGIEDYRYIPEDIYYCEIEPRLNDRTLSKAFTDKNQYHKFLDKKILPGILLRSVSGIILDEEYHMIFKSSDEILNHITSYKKSIIKPSIEGGGGYEVRLLEFDGVKIKLTPSVPGINNIKDLVSYYKRDFLIQEYIEQHSFFHQYNPDSLNTIRILTYRSFRDESIKILHRILRIGKRGSIVDNQASGGIACGIKEDGTLSGFGVDKYGRKYFEINSVILSGKIPFIEQVCSTAEQIAGGYLHSRLLGMDFAISNTGTVYLIEVNDSSNEINFYQMNNGPLFGHYSEEVAMECLREPKSFLIDFYL